MCRDDMDIMEAQEMVEEIRGRFFFDGEDPEALVFHD